MRFLMMLLAMAASLSANLWAAPVFRDHDFSKGGYGPAVKAQMEAYKTARAAYKASWKVEDVTECSRLAFTTEAATWPFVNFSWHIIETGGDLKQAETALHSAELVLGDFESKEADHIREVIEGHRSKITAIERENSDAEEVVPSEAEEPAKAGKN